MKKYRHLFLSQLFLFAGIFFSSCTHIVDIPDSKEFCYSSDIAPIISANCTVSGCHGSAGSNKSGDDLDLSSYASLLSLVKKGDPNGSQLYKVISSPWSEFMPPKPRSPLSEEQRTTIYLWILQGALDNCSENGTNNAIVDSVCFSKDVLPVFVSNCTTSGCHNAASATEGYILTDFSSIVSKGIVPGNASASKIYNVLNGTGGDRMPPAPYTSLSSEQKSLIYDWINQGAKNTSCESNCDTSQNTYSQTIANIIEASCTGCHSGTSPSFGIRIETYADVQALAANGELLSVINQTNGKPLMPPGTPLSDCEKKQIEKWINEGMQDN